jgi:D-arabinose 1-dehydrogenase-like Zn-dependent alcohol dehydrogenase
MAKKMKAAVVTEFGRFPEIQEMDVPAFGPKDVLVRSRACGICGSDIKLMQGKAPGIKVPLVMGHEFAGEVAEVGSGVKGIKPGDRAVIHIYLACNTCKNCRLGYQNRCENLQGQIGYTVPGGFAQYARVPASNLVRLPENITFSEGALLSGAMASPLHCIRRADVTSADTVAVFGAGGMGMHTIQILRAMGARIIAADIDQERLEFVKTLGASDTINMANEDAVEVIRKLTGGRGADVAIQVVDGPAVGPVSATAANSVARGGRVVVEGHYPDANFTYPVHEFAMREITVYGSRASRHQDLWDLVDMATRGLVRPLVAKTFPFEQVADAFKMFMETKVLGRITLAWE